MDTLTSTPGLALLRAKDLAPKVYILHENPEWIAPLQQHLEQLGISF